MAVIGGHEGLLTITATDRWDALDANVHVFDLDIEQDVFDRSVFDGGAGTSGSITGPTFYQGMVVVRCKVEGHMPSTRIFGTTVAGGGVIDDDGVGINTNLRDLAPGTAQSRLTLQSEKTGPKTISYSGQLSNIEIKENRRTGLVDFTADFIGELTAAA